MKGRLLILLVLAVFLVTLVPSVYANYANPKDTEAIEASLKSRLEASLPYLEGADPNRVTFVDTDLGYSYSPTEGLRKIDVYQVGPDNIVTLKDGTRVPVPSEPEKGSSSFQEGELSTQGDVGILATYEPYRRVKSNNGYRKVEGTIVIPSTSDLNGVDANGEAAYNYLGLENTSSGRNAECGIYTGPQMNKGWRVFHNFNGSWVADNWPSSPIPAGNSVFMRMYVPQDNQLAFYISYSGGSNTFVYSCTGTKYDGSNQKLRRVTSLLVNNTGSYSKNNIWKSVSIATPSDMHLWTASDIYQVTTTSYVSVVETNKYYNETVNINIP